MKISFYIFIYFIAFDVAAQFSNTHRTLRYGTQEGLSFGIVNGIVQDNSGFMWFATGDGLNRFDGISFRTFRFDPANPYSLPGNYIQGVYQDKQGQLWVTSRKGLLKFDAAHERFYLQKLQANNPNGEDISAVTAGSQGFLWISSSLHGFFRYNPATQQSINYRQSNVKGLRSNTILSTLEDSQGLVWVGTHINGLSVFALQNNKLLSKNIQHAELLHNNRINAVYEAHDHNVWIAASDGLFYYNRRQNAFHKITFTPSTKPKTQVFLSLLEDAQQHLLVGVQDGGLYQLAIPSEAEASTPQNLQPVNDNKGPVTQRSVQCLYADKDRNIWVGTYGNGVLMLDKSPQRFILFQQKNTNTEGFTRYYGMTADYEGFLWLGTDGDGIYKTTLEGKVLKHYTASNRAGSLSDNAIITAFQDSRHNLWFGSYADGLFLYDRKKDAFIHFKHDALRKNSLAANDVRVIFEDDQHRIWIGTNGGGLSLFQPANNDFVNYNTQSNNFPANDVRAITQDTQGNLWVGTYGMGLYQFNPKEGYYTAHLRETLSSGVILALAFQPKGTLWIGTQENGLVAYHTQNRTFSSYNEKTGLASNTILAINTHTLPHLWVSTNSGISKIDLRNQQIYNFDRKDGLQGGQFNDGSTLYEPRSGYMVFGGTEGWNIFKPSGIKPLTYRPSVLIMGVQLFGKEVNTDGTQAKDFIPFDNQHPQNPIELQPHQAVFSIQYGAIHYSYPDENVFAYKLEGLDNDWNYVGKQKSATYRYLDPGTYTFKVKVANKDKRWFETYASIEVVILPPWYKTWWAYTLYLCAVGVLIYFYQQYKQKQAALAYQVKIAKIEADKEKELHEKKISFFTHISHEFRTPLTLIINPIKEMLYAEVQDLNSLHIVYRNAKRLLSLVDQLLLFRKADAESDDLKLAKLSIKTCAEEVFLCFTHQAKEKNIHYEFRCENDQLEIYGDREKIEIALFNLLSNALKFTPKDGSVALLIEESKTEVLIHVKDSGAGIAPEVGDKLFQMFYQVKNTTAGGFGIGLYLTRTFINYHKGTLRYSSQLGKGTTFTIRLLKGFAHLNIEHLMPAEEVHSDILAELKEEPRLQLPENALVPQQELTDDLYAEQHTMVIIDDNEQIRQYLKQIFKAKFKLYEADNGEKGLALVTELLPDIVICDIMMQGLNGIEVCTEIKQNTQLSHIPIILLTASTSSEIKLKGIEVGADDYISKPFEKDILMARVNGILKSRNDLQKYFFNEVTLQAHNLKISPEYKQFLDQCIMVVEQYLIDPEFNVSMLATEIGMSSSSLYNRIKSICGQSPNEFIRFIRLRKAAEMLITTDSTISETAYQVGMNDSKYFREQFFKLFGMNPSAYVKKYRKPFHNQLQVNKEAFQQKKR